MKKFKTIRVSDEFIPEISELPYFDDESCISSSERNQRSGIIYFFPSALKDLDEHIHWGERRHDNVIEQGGYMLGNVYRDSGTDILFAIVLRLVPIYGAEGTAAFLDMGTDASYDATLRENEILQKNHDKMRRVGWYHTHPGGLNVFMSGTDMQTQTKSYFNDWQFAVVLNPQRRIWRGFRGSRAIEVDCIMVCGNEDATAKKFLNKYQNYSQYNNHSWKRDSKHDDLYRNDNSPEKTEHSQLHEKESLSICLHDESICIGDCMLAVNTFVHQLFNSITIEETTTGPVSLCINLLLKMQIEESQLELFTTICTKCTVNITEKEAVTTSFENIDFDENSQHKLIHVIIHYKDSISEEEAIQMAELYKFTSDNELFCIFQQIDEGIIHYYLWDHDRKFATGELSY